VEEPESFTTAPCRVSSTTGIGREVAHPVTRAADTANPIQGALVRGRFMAGFYKQSLPPSNQVNGGSP
jgi:hypothetical protein